MEDFSLSACEPEKKAKRRALDHSGTIPWRAIEAGIPTALLKEIAALCDP